MANEITIVSTELDHADGLLVTFSDETIGAYVAEELLELRPYRERIKKTPQTTLPTPLAA
jgi:hypothetical protein